MSLFIRPASIVWLLAAALSPLAAQERTPAAVAPVAAAPTPISDAEAKLAIALRSYTVIDAELDRAKAANAKLTAEKTVLEAKLAELQSSAPLAAQAAGLHEQLRQTQAQMAAYAEENLRLRTKLAMGAADSLHPGAIPSAPLAISAVAAAEPTPAAAAKENRDAPRTHVIVAGDTLVKISQAYYGTPNRWADILAANRDALRDEKSLVIGRTLVLP